MLYLADSLSLLRIILAPIVFVLGLTGQWEAAFFCLAAAWITDLLDGLAARKFGSLRNQYSKFDADGIADTVLAFFSSLVPVIYSITHTGWESRWSIALMSLYALTIVSAVWMSMVMNIEHKTKLQKRVVTVNMIVMHGVVQIGATIVWFAYMYSNAVHVSGIAGTVAGMMLLVAAGQTHKLRLWWNGQLAAV